MDQCFVPFISYCFDCHSKLRRYRVEFGYTATKGTEYFVWLLTNIVLTEEYNVMINREELFYVYGSVHHNIFYETTYRCSYMQ